MPQPASALPSPDGAPPTVVIVISQFPGPNETFIVREVAELRRRGFAVTVFSLRPPATDLPDPEARALVPLVVYPPSPWRALADVWRTMRRTPRAALRAIGVGMRDIVATLRTPVLAAKQAVMLPLALAYAGYLPASRYRLHAHFANVPTAVARILAALRGGRYSFTAHAWDIFVPENLRQLPARIAGADLVVTCTAYNRNFLSELARDASDSAKILLAYHGLELPSYDPAEARAPGLIVGGASLTEQKGLGHLVAACARLRDRGFEIRCLLIGEGPERGRLEAQIRQLRLTEHVRLTGQLPHREVIGHLRDAVVFAHPSVVERRGAMDGIPNTILEALALETPVVATRLSGIPEVVMSEQTGLLVEAGDEDGLAAALERLLRDPALGRRLGAAGRTLVLERFDVRRNVETLAARLAVPNTPALSPPEGRSVS
jgi:colanic acid/amylovoran biosynthesis glycosyltransferase